MPRNQEILVFADRKSWLWTFVQTSLIKQQKIPQRLPAQDCLYDIWSRLKQAPFIIIHWECKERSGGALIEEIKAIDADYPCQHHVIVLTTSPTQEDVIYFSELNINKVVQLQNNAPALAHAERELNALLNATPPLEIAAEQALEMRRLKVVPADAPKSLVSGLVQAITAALGNNPTQASAKTLDLQACLAFLQGNSPEAERLWKSALDKNPNYFRAWHNLIHFLRLHERNAEAFAIMKKLQLRNRANISRLVDMGELQVKLGNDEHAVHYFTSALSRDRHCSSALNGLAEVYFRQGKLDQSRSYLSRSYIATDMAAQLNDAGIHLVKERRYEEALEHYIKAQYVLPQQEKSPLLFYNIGLCYSRWGKTESARQYLEIALIKEPGYEKARKLLESLGAPPEAPSSL